MIRKNRSDFENHDDWLTHVRREIPLLEQPYVLAFGRVDLFRSFYRMQRLPFPTEFANELKLIETMHDPERTLALDALNNGILSSLTEVLFNGIRSNVSIKDGPMPAIPGEQIDELLNHLRQKNPSFAQWVAYKKDISDHSVAEAWDDYLVQELGPECTEEIEFTRAMAELDGLLTLFHDDNLSLPRLAFERIWFLHYLRGPERMAQTRAVLGMLLAELVACISA